MKPRPSHSLFMLLAMAGGPTAFAAEPAVPGTDGVITVQVESADAAPVILPLPPGAAPGAPAGFGPAEAREYKIKLARPAQAAPFNVAVPAPGQRVLFRRVATPGAMPTRIALAQAGGPGASDFAGGPVIGGDVLFYAAGPVEMKKVAYLGVSTSPVAPALASHLKLPEGFGLIVDHAQPDEPAAKAGLKPHDVIVRIGDQKLVNAMQLGTLVRAQKPGDEIELTIIREGKEMTVKAKLVEKEMPAHAMLGDATVSGLGAGPMVPLHAELTELPVWTERLQPHDIVRTRGSIRYADDEHQLEVTPFYDGLKLIVKDKAGKEIFNGPVTTEEDRKKVPEPLRAKLDKLDKSTRVTIERSAVIGPPGAMPGAPVGPGGAGVPGVPGVPGVDFGNGLDIDAVKKMIEANLKGLKLEGAQQEQLRKQIDELNKQLDELKKAGTLQPRPVPGGLGFNPAGVASFNEASTVASMNDGEHQITVTTNAKGKHLTVKDKEGKEIFAGPINNDEQLAKVPAEVREKLQTMDRATKGGIRLGAPGIPGGTPGAGAAPEPRKPANKEDDR